MAFIVEDGTGLVDSTSYVSVAEADAYMSITKDEAAWTALVLADKEKYLQFATRFLDDNVTYVGDRVSATQALRFPRNYAIDCDLMIYGEDEVPLPVKNATTFLAGYFGINTSINPSSPIDAAGDLKSVKVDVITLSWRNDIMVSAERNKYPTQIKNILRCLGKLKYGFKKGSEFKTICQPPL